MPLKRPTDKKVTSYPNQKIIECADLLPCNETSLYARVNLEALQIAMLNLTGTELKMWLYFSKNQKDYKFALSPTDAERWGIARSSFYKAVEKLIEKGFLVELNEGSNRYMFVQTPDI